MLEHIWHWHIAKKLHRPLGESRLLCFADPVEGAEPAEEEADGGEDGGPDVETVETEVEGTRGEAVNVVQGSEESEGETHEPLDILDTHQRIEDAREKLAQLIAQQSTLRKQIKDHVPKEQQQQHLDDLYEIVGFSENAQKNLISYGRISQLMVNFKRGGISTADFRKDFEEMTNVDLSFLSGMNIDEELQAIEGNSDTQIEQEAAKIALMQSVFARPEFEEVTRVISSQLAEIEESMDAVEEYAGALDEAQEKKKGGKDSMLSFWKNIEFRSIMHYVRGGKKMIEAWQKSLEEWGQLKEAKIAQEMGGMTEWLPWGQQASRVLKRENERANDTVRDEHKEGLEALKPPFKEIPTMLNKAKNNPNHFRAILEYAADHAWLYDYDPIAGTAFGINITEYLPNTWKEPNINEYLRELDNKNSSGQDSEKQRGYDRVSTKDSIAPIMIVLHKELQDNNYWAIHGILKRAMEKGKEGETSTWFATTLFRYLRDDPIARKYCPKDLIDDLGNIGIVHPAWTNTFWKLDRHTISKWQKTNEGVGSAGTLGKVIATVEDHLKEQLGFLPSPAEVLDHHVANVLAGQEVVINGKTFSIFDPRYKKYRHFLNTTPTSIDAGAADDDFYNKANRGSEVLLMGAQAFRAILDLESTGEFRNNVKAMYFLDQLIMRSENLSENGMDPNLHNAYIVEVQKKMNQWLLTNANDSRSAEKLGNAQFAASGKYMMLSLIKENIISLETLLKLSDSHKLPTIVIRQMLRDANAPDSSQIISTAQSLRSRGEINDKQLRDLETAAGGGVSPASQGNQGGTQQPGGAPTIAV